MPLQCRLRTVFMAWVAWHARAEIEAARTEIERLRQMLGKKSDSIWQMSKDQLVQIALQELGVTLAQAEGMTVLVLREKIRRQRILLKEQEDPLNSLPKGLERLKFSQLVAEIDKRGLPLPSGAGPNQATRASMILAIRDDVDVRLMVQNAGQAPRERPSKSTSMGKGHCSEQGHQPTKLQLAVPCKNCGEKTHWTKDCPALKAESGADAGDWDMLEPEVPKGKGQGKLPQ